MSSEQEKLPTQSQPAQNNQATFQAEADKHSVSKISKILLVVFVLLLLGAVGVGAYFLGKTDRNSINQDDDVARIDTDLVREEEDRLITDDLKPTVAPISGQLKRLDRDLGLFKDLDSSESVANGNVYYEAGQLSGEWEGYSRVIAVMSPYGPGQPQTFILATKNYEEYILNDPTKRDTYYQETEWENPLYYLNRDKVVKTAVFDSTLPEIITLNSQFVLYYSGLLTRSFETNKKDQYGNVITEYLLQTDLSDYQSLASPVSNLTMYFVSANTDLSYINEVPAEAQSVMRARANYVLGDTKVIVVDSVGVPAIYSLTAPEAIRLNRQAEQSYIQKRQQYQQALTKYEAGEIAEYPQYPESPGVPNLGFEISSVQTESADLLFSEYQTAFPSVCALETPGTLVKVDDDDLEEIGKVYQLPIYRLKSSQHDLNKLAYSNKMQSFQDSEEMFHEVNPGVAFLSFEEYVEKTPLLFLKDYWGRWVALGEYQILLPGGCGKPVIYLYPTQPTEVTVKLLSPTRFSVDVPKYDPVKGWRVLALPNGDLIDQQPDLTSCDQFVSTRFGLEYAAEACQAQTYPYLYWAGSVIDQTYLQPSTGWVVEKKDLEKFFKDKLSKMGFIEQEMNEFNKYWIPQMSSHPESIFRISFLQTDELNQLFPMAVEPTPKSMLRMFLDYQPLQKYPSQLPIPQVLNKVERSGFTLVEWGGLKR